MSVLPVGFNRAVTQGDCPNLLEANGPTAACYVGFDPDYDAKLASPPNIPNTTRQGLIDTGASHSSIDADLAKELNLPIVDKKPVGGVHGQIELEICSAQVYLPLYQYTTYGLFALVRLKDGGFGMHDVLFGRTMLRSFTLYYDGASGYTRLSR
jgi:hypothetical protein